MQWANDLADSAAGKRRGHVPVTDAIYNSQSIDSRGDVNRSQWSDCSSPSKRAGGEGGIAGGYSVGEKSDEAYGVRWGMIYP